MDGRARVPAAGGYARHVGQRRLRRVEVGPGESLDDIVHRVRRQHRNGAPSTGTLVPWDVDPRHRQSYSLTMLRP